MGTRMPRREVRDERDPRGRCGGRVLRAAGKRGSGQDSGDPPQASCRRGCSQDRRRILQEVCRGGGLGVGPAEAFQAGERAWGYSRDDACAMSLSLGAMLPTSGRLTTELSLSPTASRTTVRSRRRGVCCTVLHVVSSTAKAGHECTRVRLVAVSSSRSRWFKRPLVRAGLCRGRRSALSALARNSCRGSAVWRGRPVRFWRHHR